MSDNLEQELPSSSPFTITDNKDGTSTVSYKKVEITIPNDRLDLITADPLDLKNSGFSIKSNRNVDFANKFKSTDFREYVSEMAFSYPRLNSIGEKVLLLRAISDDKRAVNRLMNSHIFIALNAAKYAEKNGGNFDNAFTEACISILDSIYRFDFSVLARNGNEVKFLPYVNRVVINSIKKYLDDIDEPDNISIPVGFDMRQDGDTFISESLRPTEEFVINKITKDNILDMISKEIRADLEGSGGLNRDKILTNWLIFLKLFGFGLDKELSISEIASEYKISKEKVWEIYSWRMRRIRKDYSKLLR